MLQDILRAAEARADHSCKAMLTTGGEELTVGILLVGALTRGQLRQTQPVRDTPPYINRIREVEDSPTSPTPSDVHILEPIYPRREARRVMNDVSPFGSIPDSLTDYMSELQSKDDWCKNRKWEGSAAAKLSEAYRLRWEVSAQTGLVLCDGRVYVPQDHAMRAEILLRYHDDPWSGGHFGTTRTLSAIQEQFSWL